jgi:acyl-ACP thioesterase
MSARELTEMIAEPDAGRVFEDCFYTGGADAGPTGRVRLDAIARWLQDLAYADIADAGALQQGVWILRRLRIRVEAFPRIGDQLRLRSFCSGIGRFSAERRSSISSASGKVEAVALWVFLDPEAGRPVRFRPDFLKEYAVTAAGRDANVRLHHPAPPADAEGEPWAFRAGDLDAVGHVNNSHYWLPLEEELAAGPEPAAIDAEIEFHDPAGLDPVRIVRGEQGMWITSPEGRVHASIAIAR